MKIELHNYKLLEMNPKLMFRARSHLLKSNLSISDENKKSKF
jgi:hypothetical protein